MPRYKLTVAYDGANFNGWQRQKGDDVDPVDVFDAQSPGIAIPGRSAEQTAGPRPVRTVQAVLERAVREVVREPVEVVGASRTDAGVHAVGQVAAFSSARAIPVHKLPRAVTARLPEDVQVRRAEIVADDFDPIRHAIAKGYAYRILHSCARLPRPLFDRGRVTQVAYELDVVRMNEAARQFLGEHDFESFTRINHGRESTVRTIYECKVTATGSRRCRLEVAGNGFLYNMIRIIAGTLIEIGRGARGVDTVPKMLAARDRRAAGATAPPDGLCLMWIRYPEPASPASAGLSEPLPHA